MAPAAPLWTPSPTRVRGTAMHAFLQRTGHADYPALHAWSVREPAAFWRELWDFCGVRGEMGERVLVDGDRLPGARWFPDARLSVAENLLWRRDDAPAIVLQREDGHRGKRPHHGVPSKAA